MESKREKRITDDAQVSVLDVREQMEVLTTECKEKNIFEGQMMNSFFQCLLWACNGTHELGSGLG